MDRHGIYTADRSCRAEQPKMSQNFDIAAFVFELLNVKVEKFETRGSQEPESLTW